VSLRLEVGRQASCAESADVLRRRRDQGDVHDLRSSQPEDRGITINCDLPGTAEICR
jgi:hypothetical protein